MASARGWRHTPVPVLQRRIRVALGQEAGDLLLRGGRVVNVFTQEIEDADVVIADGWIAGVGKHDWQAATLIDLEGRTVLPGLIDGHMHVESTLLMPFELARLVVPHGTTTLIADPHELGNVLGVPGIDLLLQASEGLPLDIFCMASSCVPAVAWDDAGAVLGPAEVAELLRKPRVLGLAEVMDMEAVLGGGKEVCEKIEAALASGRAVDGHAPGLRASKLQAYVAAGMRADHESTEIEEARAKARLGMMVQVREGSAEHNLDDLMPLLVADELGDWCLCTDDLLPDDLHRLGHIDHLLKRVLAAGVSAPRAVRHASLVPARHYGLDDRGAVAPGYRADLFIVDDLRELRSFLTVKNGKVASQGLELDWPRPPAPPPAARQNTVHVADLPESAFTLRLAKASVPVIRIIEHQIVTRTETMSVAVQDGCWKFDANRDVLLAASIERHKATGKIGLGLVAGFGLKQDGALGSTVAHDAHNIVLAGSNPRDLELCVDELARMGGGFVVVAAGKILARLPLPVAGLLATDKAEDVIRALKEVNQAAQTLGCPLDAPFGYLSFLALPVIPELRITDQGLYDVAAQQFVTLS